jgi:hypothetical protein
VRVHLAGEHPLELEALDVLAEPVGVRLDLADRAKVALARGEFEELARIRKALGQAVDGADDGFELRALLAEFLGALRLVPDTGLFQLAGYFLQALVLVGVIKDTPEGTRCDPRVP